MFQRTADDRGGDIVSALLPCMRALPAAFSDKIIEGVTDGWRVTARASRPREMMRNVLAQGDYHHARPELRHAEVGSVEEVPFGVVAHLLESGLEPLPKVFEYCTEDAPDVFEHNRAGLRDLDKIQGDWEQVALVPVAELLASY